MITAKLALCAREIVRDAATNNISVFNVLEGLNAQGFPFLLHPFAVLFILEREPNDPAEQDSRFELTLGDRELMSSVVRVNFEDKPRTRQMIRLDGLAITEPGVLRSRLSINNAMVAEYSFQIDGPPPQAGAVRDGGPIPIAVMAPPPGAVPIAAPAPNAPRRPRRRPGRAR